MVEAHTISVPRTARYFVSSPLREDTREVWFVLHGYGQTAEDFLREFEGVASDRCLVVAPEGLSRFYLEEGTGVVGASWMTKVDRELEIADYVRYLDAVHAELLGSLDPQVRVHTLGFSQGTATAARWVAFGHSRSDRLTLWGGGLPPDLDLGLHRELFERVDLSFVVGERDEFIDAKRVEAEVARLRDAGIPHRLIRFAGGHRLDRETLAALA